MKRITLLVAAVLLVGCGDIPTGTPPNADPAPQSALVPTGQAANKIGDGVREVLDSEGSVPVLVMLSVDGVTTNVGPTRPNRGILRASIARAQNGVLASFATDLDVFRQYSLLPGFAARVNSRGALQALATHPLVTQIALDQQATAALAETVPLVGANQRWSTGNTGSGVNVAVLDSGIDTDHADLVSSLVAQVCKVSGGCPGGEDDAEDDSFRSHGTHIAGVITSDGDNGIAARGAAPDAGIVAVKVLNDSDVGEFSDIIAGLEWVVENSVLGGGDIPIHVVNMSVTAGRFSSSCDADFALYAYAIDAVVDLGIPIVAATGNSNLSNAIGLPACFENTIAVGNSTADDAVYTGGSAGVSGGNRSAFTDLLAPGVAIVSAANNGGTTTATGTSFSAPHVAACAALLIQSGEATTPGQIRARLSQSSTSITDPETDLSYPRLDCRPTASTGTIKITKVTAPTGRTAFGFVDNIPGSGTFSLDDGQTKTFQDVATGTYTVNEVGSGSYMELSGIECSDPTGDTSHSGASATIRLAPGETVTCSFTNRDLPPTTSATPVSQRAQYSDGIQSITVRGIDSSQDVLSAAFSYDVDASGSFTAGLPAGMTASAGACSVSEDTQTCTWIISGTANVPAGSYRIRASVTDSDGGGTPEDVIVLVAPESADVTWDSENPVSVRVAADGGNSGPFSMTVRIAEAQPDLNPGSGGVGVGDLSKAGVSMQLNAIGAGASPTGVCITAAVTGTGYDQVLEATCSFDDVPVNTYAATVTVNATGYFAAIDEDVVTVFDPSLGFTTGGGWFHWPGTNERTNFGYTMKYNRKGDKVRGSLLMIRHAADGAKYRVKSNALEGLALGQESGVGWASFSGKSTYLEPGWLEAVGNHSFVVYVEDRAEPGAGADGFWIEVHDKDGNTVETSSMDREAAANVTTLGGGNVVVPHQGGR